MKRKTVSNASDDNDDDNDDDWGDERRVSYKKGKQLQVQESSSWAECSTSSRNSSRLQQRKCRLFELFNWNFILQRLLTMSTIFVGINDILFKNGSCSALRYLVVKSIRWEDCFWNQLIQFFPWPLSAHQTLESRWLFQTACCQKLPWQLRKGKAGNFPACGTDRIVSKLVKLSTTQHLLSSVQWWIDIVQDKIILVGALYS